MNGLLAFARGVDGINRAVGTAVSWLTLGTVLACFATVYTRYALGVNYIWLQEAYIWQHAAVIVLGAGYTMLTDGFVRVDILYAKWSAKRKAAIDLVLTLGFLFPFLGVFGYVAWNFFMRSYLADEGSQNPGGIPNVWLLKACMVGFVVLVGLQGLALAARCIVTLAGGKARDDVPATAPAGAAA
jgi:TRAP-type mannitol/chloroaromatic compound transport system permease small subunit